MIVSDQVFYVLIAVFAIIFSLMTFDLPDSGIYAVQTPDQDTKSDLESLYGVGRIFTKVRLVLYPSLAAMFWMVLGVLTLTLNNCAFSFNTCFTNPTLSTSTATITDFSYSSAAGLLFTALGIIFVVITIFAGIAVWAVHMKAIASKLGS